MQNMLPQTRDLVLIGGGHTHAIVLRKWGMNPLPGVRLTLISPGPTAAYSGMLPGFVAGHYTRDELDIDLVKLARFAGARLIDGAVTGIDLANWEIEVPGRPPVAYDVVSVDVGITSDMPTLPGFADHGIPAKPLAPFASRWDAFRLQASDPHIVVLGGGVAGAELSMAMAHALRSRNLQPTVHLIDRSAAMTGLNDTARVKLRAALDSNGIQVMENTTVSAIEPGAVVLDNGQRIRSDFTTGAAGAKPHDWVSGIAVDLHDGYIAVGPTLQSSDPAIFAVGDCAHLTHDPRPKAGVYAVREAPILFDNLCAVLSGDKLRHYTPQGDYLKLISLGGKSALAERFGTAFAGGPLWRWKDHIDRKFMRRFSDLPQMTLPNLPKRHALGLPDALGDKPMCGGCGAKVGRAALQAALSDLPAPQRDDVVRLAGDDAGLLTMGQVRQVVSTDHLRAFWDDPVLMTRIALTHALGDIWAMGAAPQAATVNLILPRLSADLQSRTVREIVTTARHILSDAGAEVIGGHTSLGAELTIGFTVTGLCDAAPITLGGAQVGDALILTKPIGSGTIMAAEMAGKGRGADVAAALAAMCQGQAQASTILRDAHAMTDVTGFGLAGHLRGICDASGVGANIVLADVPLLNSALALAAAGTRSSLFTDNETGAGAYEAAPGPRRDLMFDPQTAGGLLAAVSPGQVDAIVQALRAAGYADAARIGTITAGDRLRLR
ncbi:selenide, water dikinase SelD [Loktanella sp. SALINAS62]|uniref:selenide, water dikinase SelD n=1 Tax=Loktanella sp. SALINAS62 TaxID=2706124 RepID=UPI001B8D9A27|nr:selenide, water dikinase SelD [Loktanella sp. SALINAS62]MBS1302367.1 selenide, water dikinase SelD [Loktanella sp. SALINAS62]